MINSAWNLEDEERDTDLTGTPRPLLTTWRFLSNSLRRGWRTWVVLAGLGGVLGLVALVLMPPGSVGTVTLLMVHPANVDGPSAMATDVSLVTTREVAALTARELGLDVSPDTLRSTIRAVPVTDQILTITVTATNDRSAVTRTEALVSQYLDFRATQMRSLNSGLVDGYQTRIADMQGQLDTLNQRYDQLSQQGAAAASQALAVLSQRNALNSQITSMQQAIEDATFQTNAAIASTHVIDPAHAVQQSVKKAAVLDVGSGIIAGAAIGMGIVLLRALTSDKLRRRQDVALALGAPVRVSVVSNGPQQRPLRRVRQRLWARLPLRRAAVRGAPWRGRDLEALVYGLESAVTPHTVEPRSAKPPSRAGSTAKRHGPSKGLALAAIGNPRATADLVSALAARLRVRGLSVLLVDLSESGALAALETSAQPPSGPPGTTEPAKVVGSVGGRSGPGPSVFRPAGVPGLARGPRGAAPGAAVELGVGDARRGAWDAAHVVLALVEVDPGIDVENLGSWVDEVVPHVTAGRSSAELLETTAQLIRAAGITLRFAVMTGSDRSDESYGLFELSEPDPAASSSHA